MTNRDTTDGRRVGRWAAMALGTYLLTGVVYGLLVFVSAGETPFSGASLEVMASFILPAFYANPARALTAPAIAVTAFVVSVIAVVLVARAIRGALESDSAGAGARTRRDSG